MLQGKHLHPNSPISIITLLHKKIPKFWWFELRKILISINVPSEIRAYRWEKIWEINKRTGTFISYSRVHKLKLSSVFHHFPSVGHTQAVECVSSTRSYPQSGYVLVYYNLHKVWNCISLKKSVHKCIYLSPLYNPQTSWGIIIE